MTVEEPGVVDFVAGKDDRPEVLLVIADHLEWAEENRHLFTLQEKINRYLAFVESGEFAAKFPRFRTKRPTIHVRFLHAPTDHALRHFLEPARVRIREAGLDLTWLSDEAG